MFVGLVVATIVEVEPNEWHAGAIAYTNGTIKARTETIVVTGWPHDSIAIGKVVHVTTFILATIGPTNTFTSRI